MPIDSIPTLPSQQPSIVIAQGATQSSSIYQRINDALEMGEEVKFRYNNSTYLIKTAGNQCCEVTDSNGNVVDADPHFTSDGLLRVNDRSKSQGAAVYIAGKPGSFSVFKGTTALEGFRDLLAAADKNKDQHLTQAELTNFNRLKNAATKMKALASELLNKFGNIAGQDKKINLIEGIRFATSSVLTSPAQSPVLTPAPKKYSDQPSRSAVALFTQARDLGGKLILDWDNTIDIDKLNTLGPTALEWMNELAESGLDAYLVTRKSSSEKETIKNIVLEAVAEKNSSYWKNLFDKRAYFSSENKTDEYQTIIAGSDGANIGGSDGAKWILFDDTDENVLDFLKVTKNKGSYYRPQPFNGRYATYDGVVYHMKEFVGKLEQ